MRPGEKVALNGVVREGGSAVDESMMTGEPIPVEEKAGDRAIGGTLNTSGSLVIEATQVGKDTLLARIVQMVPEAQRSRAPAENYTLPGKNAGPGMRPPSGLPLARGLLRCWHKEASMARFMKAAATVLLAAGFVGCATSGAPSNPPCASCSQGTATVKKGTETHAYCVVDGKQVDCTRTPPECPACAKAGK